MKLTSDLKRKTILALIVFVVLWFIFLCLLNYFAQKPRMDEGEIQQNIAELTVPQLFGELRYNQVFPRAYLALISIYSSYFSYSLLALRFFPLLFMLLGFFLWIYIYKKEANNLFYLFLLIFSFASSVFTIDYAAYLKQYSCDLFTIAVFTIFIYHQKEYFQGRGNLKYLWLFSILTPVLIVFSQMSVFIFWMIIYNYLFFIKKDKAVVKLLLVYTGLVAIFCWLVYRFDIIYSLRVKFMQEYWKDCFINTSSVYGFIKTFTNGLQNLIVRWFVEAKLAKGFANVFMPFCLVAIVRSFWLSFRENKGRIFDINAICLVLILELLVLGIFKAYPFTGARVTLFIAPFIFYMIVKGIYLTKKIKFIFLPLISLYIIFLLGVSGYLLTFYLGFYHKG